MEKYRHSFLLKLDRAYEQIQALSVDLDEWKTRNPLEFDCVLREKRLGFKLIVKEFREPTPLDRWSLLFGECVHNLRSSLDNLAYALAMLKKDPPDRPNQIAYPIFKERSEYDRYGKNKIAQLPGSAINIIEQLQPFQRTGSANDGKPEQDPLLLLQYLSNTDKHRIPSIALIAPKDIQNKIRIKFYTEEDADKNLPPDFIITDKPLSPGVVLMEWGTNCPIEYVEGELNAGAIISIESNKGALDIIQTLVSLHNYINIVISQFVPLFDNK